MTNPTPPAAASDAAIAQAFRRWHAMEPSNYILANIDLESREIQSAQPSGVAGDWNAQVRVTLDGVAFGKYCWFSHEKITGFSAEAINTSQAPTLKAYREWLTNALAPPPIAQQGGGEVTEEMVLAALDAQPFKDANEGTRVWQTLQEKYHLTGAEKIMRAALTAALASKADGGES